MPHLRIKNIGPIKYADIELNKVNVIMGPQSSGKSTINKIACYCSWVEKKISLDQSFDYFLKEGVFIEELARFHKLTGYFKETSEIEYHSETINLKYIYKDKEPVINWKNQFGYKRIKLSYIPAERNSVSMISDWKEVSLPNNNIRNFMADWNNARKIFTPEKHIHLPFLEIDYYYDEKSDMDYIQNQDGTVIQLMDASSGLQSMIPLVVLRSYFAEWIYTNEEPRSIASKERDSRFLNILISTLSKQDGGIQFTELEPYIIPYIATAGTGFFIEEPELNLFPSTQRDILYNLISSVQQREDDSLILTTHSPYILYALNNCMLGFQVKETMPKTEQESLASRQSWIDPSLVSAWEIKDGKLVDIKNSRLNTIGDHYFNTIMNEVMDEYYAMLKYIKRTK